MGVCARTPRRICKLFLLLYITDAAASVCTALPTNDDTPCQTGEEEQHVLLQMSLEKKKQQQIEIRTSVLDTDELNTVGWNPDTLVKVRELLAGDAPSWAESAMKKLSQQAQKFASLPANIRKGVSAGPWSVTFQGPNPQSPGTSRDYTTVSGYYWPCHAACPTSVYGEEKCTKGWKPTVNNNGCDQETGLPYTKHDGFLNYDNLQDLTTMIAMMDTVEKLTLAWWLLPEHETTFAQTAVRVLRSWFFNETIGMLPRMLYGAGIPGKYPGTAGALIAPSFRLGTRLSDCIELLKTGGADVWSTSDDTSWHDWSHSWVQWLETSEFGQNELGAVGNHATFLFSHKLAMARATGNSAMILDIVAKLRTEFAGSLTEQITPSGEMPIETRRVTGATYARMNLNGLFRLGEAVENACRGLSCSPAWDWSWEVDEAVSGKWEAYSDQISYCRYKGKGSTDSVDACKQSCMDQESGRCNGVVTRHKHGTLVGCYFKLCYGTMYKLKARAPALNVYNSYHYVKGPVEGSGSLRKALDFLRPYALGEKSFAADFPETIDGAESWRDMALPLRIASIKFGNATYEAEIASVDPDAVFSKFSLDALLFPAANLEKL